MTSFDPVALAAVIGECAAVDRPLGALTTYKVGGRAAVLAAPRTVDELLRVASVAREAGAPVLVVGRGSNMLVCDDGFAGVAVTLGALVLSGSGSGSGRADGITIHPAGSDGRVAVVAGGAVALPVLARRTASAGVVGFEWAVGVPGSVGGAVRMNAGGHGSDMAASLVEADVVDLLRGERRSVVAERLGLRFRGSALADHQVVVAARLDLAQGDPAEAEEHLAAIVKWRRENQPGGQNAGSVFVNPVPGELAAAQVIDSLGLRGLRIGGASVSDKHANFIQADPGARAADVYAVMCRVREVVERETGRRLRSEVRLVGFPPLADDGDDDLHTGVDW